jgi:hypothetical protein
MADLKVNADTQVDKAIPTKQGVIGIAQATSSANGTHYPRSNWTNYLSYIGDTSLGGYGILCGTLQCNVNETTTSGTVMDTIYGFAATQSASLRMNGHSSSTSEDIWYGASGNNTQILNNQGSRAYTQYASNTFAIPVQKKY